MSEIPTSENESRSLGERLPIIGRFISKDQKSDTERAADRNMQQIEARFKNDPRYAGWSDEQIKEAAQYRHASQMQDPDRKQQLMESRSERIQRRYVQEVGEQRRNPTLSDDEAALRVLRSDLRYRTKYEGPDSDLSAILDNRLASPQAQREYEEEKKQYNEDQDILSKRRQQLREEAHKVNASQDEPDILIKPDDEASKDRKSEEAKVADEFLKEAIGEKVLQPVSTEDAMIWQGSFEDSGRRIGLRVIQPNENSNLPFQIQVGQEILDKKFELIVTAPAPEDPIAQNAVHMVMTEKGWFASRDIYDPKDKVVKKGDATPLDEEDAKKHLKIVIDSAKNPNRQNETPEQVKTKPAETSPSLPPDWRWAGNIDSDYRSHAAEEYTRIKQVIEKNRVQSNSNKGEGVPSWAQEFPYRYSVRVKENPDDLPVGATISIAQTEDVAQRPDKALIRIHTGTGREYFYTQEGWREKTSSSREVKDGVKQTDRYRKLDDQEVDKIHQMLDSVQARRTTPNTQAAPIAA